MCCSFKEVALKNWRWISVDRQDHDVRDCSLLICPVEVYPTQKTQRVQSKQRQRHTPEHFLSGVAWGLEISAAKCSQDSLENRVTSCILCEDVETKTQVERWGFKRDVESGIGEKELVQSTLKKERKNYKLCWQKCCQAVESRYFFLQVKMKAKIAFSFIVHGKGNNHFFSSTPVNPTSEPSHLPSVC